jgi:stage V sporulation protein D (sporulation-specific penicillin-binding protein)
MKKNMTFHKRKIWVVLLCCILMMTGLIGRLVYLMCFRSDYYYKKAKELHEREREIKAARGEIVFIVPPLLSRTFVTRCG